MRRAATFMLLLLAAPQARADPACDTIAALDRMVVAARTGAVEELDRLMRRVDAPRIGWNLADHPLSRHGAEIDAALDAVEKMRTRARPGAPPAPPAEATRAAAALDRLAALVARYGCEGVAPDTASDGAMLPENAVLQVGGLTKAGLAMLAAFGTSGLLAWVVVRRERRRARQARRHPVNLPARLKGAQGEAMARVIDLSRLGAKLRVGPDLAPGIPERLTMLCDGQAWPATGRWRTSHYLGIEFERPLDAEALARLIGARPEEEA